MILILLEHIDLAQAVLSRAEKSKPLTLLKYKTLQIEKYKTRVNQGVGAGDERSLIAFMQKELEPLFPVFSERGEPVINAVDAYNDAVNPSIGTMVRGGEERLTQPLRIALIYSTQNELQEALRHVERLQHETFLTDEVESLELEDLTDIQKLHAVRVRVNVDSAALAHWVGIK